MDDVDFNHIQINYELCINRIHLIKVKRNQQVDKVVMQDKDYKL